MSFLAPLFLLGGLAIALPVVFHLIRRTSRVRTLFSSLMFLRPGPPRVTRRNRLEDLLLLALRCLVLGLLAFGFARPFLKRPFEAVVVPAVSSQVMVLLDTSASMRRGDLWSAARRQWEQVAEGMGAGDQLALWAFDRQVREIFGFEGWNAVPVSERLGWARSQAGNLQPGWGASQLDAALIAAADALGELGVADGADHRRIVVISDMQEGTALGRLQAFDWPAGVEVELAAVGPLKTSNAGLQGVAAAETEKASDGPTVRVRLENAPDASLEQFRLVWTGATGEVGAPIEVYVPAGQNRVVPIPAPPGGVAVDRVVLRGDEESFDNELFVLPPEPRQAKVAYLGGESVEDSAQPLFFLKKAFRETSRLAVEVEVLEIGRPPGGGAGSDARLWIATGPLTPEWAERVRREVETGKTLLLVPVSAEAAATYVPLVGEAGRFGDEVVPRSYGLLGELDFRHPLLAPFADPRFSDFTRIHFWRYRRVEVDRAPGARVVARFDGGDAALAELPLGRGRVMVMASGWHPRDSQLALSSKFVPLCYSLLDLAGGVPARRVQASVGDRIAGFEGAEGAGQELRVLGPGGEEVTGPAGAVLAERPGIYRLEAGTEVLRLPVNLAPEESRTAPMGADDLERLGVPLRGTERAPATVAVAAERLHAVELERSQKLWRWFLLGTLTVLVVETILGARASHRAAGGVAG